MSNVEVVYTYVEHGLKKSVTISDRSSVSIREFTRGVYRDKIYSGLCADHPEIKRKYPSNLDFRVDYILDRGNTCRLVDLYKRYAGISLTGVRVSAKQGDSYDIPADAFYNCDELVDVQLAEGLAAIGTYAFYGCTALSVIELPYGVKAVEDRAFMGCYDYMSCTGLEMVILPSAPPTIAETAFLGGHKPTIIVRVDERHPERLSSGQYKVVPLDEDDVRMLALSRSSDEGARGDVAGLASSAKASGRCATSEDIASDPASLRRYLKVVADAEAHVFQLSEELLLALSRKRLLESALENRNWFDSLDREKEEQDRKAKAAAEKKTWEKERRAILAGERLTERDKRDIGDKPSQPIDPREKPAPCPPEKPVLAKPGFFNRRRVEEENARLEREYAEALASYESEAAERQRLIDQYNTDLESYEAELEAYEERRGSAIERQLSERGYRTFKSKVKKVQRVDSRIATMLRATAKANGAFCSELSARLVEAAGLLKAAYSADIVFPKYRNLAAMTTMYEYFETGRCASLQGPDGAYNLYESETRSGAIIGKMDVISGKLDVISGKLDVISGKLDQLQQSQYVLYTAIEGANRRLGSLNRTMEEVLEVAKDTKGTVQQISAKATAVVNSSAETAYWARKNAELTDSLGYLVAFSAL